MTQTVEYQKHYYAGSRKELIAKVKEQVSEKRFKHILGVEQAALELAQANDYELEKASVAALVHDYAKERSDSEFKALIVQTGLEQDLLNWNNFIWHGVVGAEIIKKELKITDEEILNAVRRHTVGAKEMTMLDQIVYVADYIEPGRDFPGVDQARQLAAESLRAAVEFETKHTLLYLMNNDKTIYPAAILTYNAYVAS
ncbi:bis(5'-nucleosyl)-tetraphosphatase (symmetrical) YqeK [Ligilactobacillus murinus]|uniref:bis(5'-nucleosyl)-tetraphosphatase (symmetrical) YqeK n=1 Tax=Ligilactobacillus murinus TaxID=1622 RepID=UPI000E8B4BAC|nr:bis(5'-nucleosyl)-tetraphosphatase (symmetrical) YqeK [Ligilactobacillus murinus]MCR1890278.1 bis(5'-nucleosyl)-tetraphosphatase (symmetrical) YqeK [Ligilactobacillus murinus]MCR1896991.1 bis(5'-nucleosyl)-tetraphosphatase (symmetrical) YqeK [Ligilactobacillus murinus]HBV48566.1 HD domain-containing protein [Lactobacillus sp.]